MRSSTKLPQGDKIEYSDFLGISHAKDATRIPKGYLLRAVNFDIDVEMMAHRRRGFKKLLDVGVSTLWSNEFVSFFVGTDGNMYQLFDDWSYSVILKDVGLNRMEFQDVNGIVYFTNNQIIGYIQGGVAYAFPEVDQTYKDKMVGGQLLEFFDSRLYTAKDDIIIFSDAARPMVRDIRHNFLQVSGRVRMIKSVVDGLYVSEGEHVSFYSVSKDDPPKFKRTPIIDVPCFEGMAIKIEGEKISPKIEAVVVIWPGGEGCFMGKPGGEFERLTGRNLFIGGVARGCGAFLVRLLHGFNPGFPQYVGIYDELPGFGEGEAILELPRLTVQVTGKSS